MTVSLTLRIITGSAEYVKEIPQPYPNQWRLPIWKACCDTLKQLNSEQYILSKGFKRVH